VEVGRLRCLSVILFLMVAVLYVAARPVRETDSDEESKHGHEIGVRSSAQQSTSQVGGVHSCVCVRGQ